MRYLLVSCLTIFFLPAFSQKIFIRDLSMGYRIGEGEAVGGSHFTVPVLLKKPVAFQNFLNNLDYNSMYGNGSPVTYHRIFVQAELGKRTTSGKFWRNTSVPVGLNFSFREKRGEMGIGNQYWYTQPVDSTLDSKMYWMEQKQQFFGLHTGLHRRIKIGKNLRLITGILLQGEVAVKHQYNQWADTASYSRIHHKYVYFRSDKLPELKGRNFFQWSVLVPLATEINIYKKQWLIKPEVTIGWLGNRYLTQNNYSLESINAALWFIYRRS